MACSFITPMGIPLNRFPRRTCESSFRSAASGQGPVEDAACDIVIAGSARKIAAKFGNKAQKFMLLEAGHVAQNIQLQAVSLGLASLPVGSFEMRNVCQGL